jgi:hypothetical protein
LVEGLLVGVDENKRHIFDALIEHVVNGVVAAATNANHFDALSGSVDTFVKIMG